MTDALAKAVHATMTPGQEVKFTVAREEDWWVALDMIVQVCRDRIDFDKSEKSTAQETRSGIIIEFTNGSCIVIRRDR